LPNEVVDAYTTVATLQRYSDLVAELETFHADNPQRIHGRFCRQMDALRNNVPYDVGEEVTEAICEAQERRFGKPVADTSDAALVSLGFEKE